MPTLDLFDAETNQYVSGDDAAEFAALVDNAFDLIKSVSACLHRDIVGDVKWVVRVRSPGLDVHRSFTTPALDGVLFLSHLPGAGSGGAHVIAEAIVHERSHLHVHRMISVLSLHTLPQTETFYSPWRSDPRPLNGLLHGLYVLARLCEFYKTALKAPPFAHDVKIRNFFRQRLSWCQVSAAVGLLQVPTAALTSEGVLVVENVSKATRLDEAAPDRVAVETVAAHVNNWRKQHGALSHRLEVPHWL